MTGRFFLRPQAFLLAIALLGPGILIDSAWGQTRGPAPWLGLSQSKVDLGITGHLQVRKFQIEITNNAPETVSVIARPTCDCLKLTFRGQDLLPGETRVMRVEARLGRGKGTLRKKIELSPQARGAAKQVVTVSWRYHPGITWEPQSLKLYGAVDGTLASGQASFSITGQKELRVGAAEVERVRGVELIVTKHVIDAKKVRVHVAIKPGATKPGRFQGHVRILINDLPLVVPVNGVIFENLAVDPESFVFSRVESLAAGRRSLRVSATDGKAFKILSSSFVENRRHQAGEMLASFERREDGSFEVTLQLGDNCPPRAVIGGELVLETTHPEQPELTIKVIGFVALKTAKKSDS